MVDSSIVSQRKRFIHYYQDSIVLLHTKKPQVLSMQYSITRNILTKKITKEPKDKNKNINPIKYIPIDALFGIMQLNQGTYLLAVTKSTCLGQIYEKKIYKVEKMDFFLIGKGYQNSILDSDKPYIPQLPPLFFSDQYNLTTSLQSFVNSGMFIDKRVSQFWWNQCLLQQVIKVGAIEWITGFISGVFDTRFIIINGYNTQYSLISRRDKRRVGVRFWSRGADMDGNVSNCVETQQIVSFHRNNNIMTFSLLQSRGSMPFKWSQKPDMKWAPSAKIQQKQQLNIELCRKHLRDQQKRYGKLMLLNLIDEVGTQKRLGENFKKYVQLSKQKDVDFLWFDFHKKCKNMKYQNLAQLLDRVQKQIQQYGYFYIAVGQNKQKVLKNQTGCFRTNCMDCLDRTNVVQSVIARRYLHYILYQSGITLKSPKGLKAFEKLPDAFQQAFRHIWTQNADILSLQYSGTPALKTDFTKTGKRTRKGQISDAFNSIKRYFLGIFNDHQKQVCCFNKNSSDILLRKMNPKNIKIKKSSSISIILLGALVIQYNKFFIVPYMSTYGCSYLEGYIQSDGYLMIGVECLMVVFSLLGLVKLLPLTGKLFISKPILQQ